MTSPTQACLDADKQLTLVRANLKVDPLAERLTIGTLGPGQADAALAEMNTHCSPLAQVQLGPTLQRQEGIRPDQLESFPHLAAAQASTPGAFGQFAYVLRNVRSDMRTLEATLAERNKPLAGIRQYSVEEQADDFATIALYRLGIPSSNYRYLFPKLTGRDLAACQAIVDAGGIPPYGPLDDNHHAGCYRAYHAKALEAHLAQGGRYVVGGIAR